MIKRFKQILIIAVTLYVGLGAAAQAAIYDIPANALLNNNHLYVIDNTNSKVEAYRYNSSSWVTYDLPSPLIPLLGAQSFGPVNIFALSEITQDNHWNIFYSRILFCSA